VARLAAFALVFALVLAAWWGGAPTGTAAARGSAGGASAPEVYGGVGSWLDIFAGSVWSQADAVVAAAKADGVGTIYLQTSNYSQPAAIVRPAALGRFLAAAHAAGLRVVGWYLPGLANPGLDARRALAAIRFRSASGQRFDGFALDIEAGIVSSVGLRNARLLALARLLRRSVAARYPLGAIIPSPVGMHRHPRYWPGFPYRGLARSFDAFLPMAYFSSHAHTRRAVYAYARDVVAEIRARTGNPNELIHVIGGIATGLTQPAMTGFVEAVSDCGAQGISLYAFPQTSPREWADLDKATLGRPATADCRG
jgi:hypothetical protein